MEPTAAVIHRTRAQPRHQLADEGAAGRSGPPEPSGPTLGWAGVGIALVLAASPLLKGYFDFGAWGPIALGSIALLVLVLRFARLSLTGYGMAAAAGIGILLALSAASMLWAESKDSAWTSVNRLAFYVVVFALVLLTVRNRTTGRLVVLMLGSAALLTGVWLCTAFLIGDGQTAFLTRRLNAPIDYINGTAGFLVIGLWPWLALAETASSRLTRSAALASASLIASTLVLTQSRAILPAAIFSALVVLICADNRTRRAVNLIIVGASVAIGLPWTLSVYSTAPGQAVLPGHGLLRGAAMAMLAGAFGAGLIRLALARAAEMLPAERKSRGLRRLGRTLALASIVSIGLVAVIGGPSISRQYRSFTALHLNRDVSVRFIDASGFRYDLWRVAVREFESHLLGGLGAGNYDVAYYRLRDNPEYVVQPHSLELQMAAELGVGGIAALLLFCGAILAAAGARARTLASGDRMIKIAAAGMFAAWLADTSVDWLYDIPGLTAMAMVAAALLVVSAPSRGDAPPRRRRRPAPMLAGLVALALIAASIGRQYAATRYAGSGAAQVAHSPASAISTLRQAATLDPYSLGTLYALAAAYASRNDYVRARDTLLLAEAREPHNSVPPALLGDLAVRRGDYGLAAAEYRRALALNPRDRTIRQAELDATAGSR